MPRRGSGAGPSPSAGRYGRCSERGRQARVSGAYALAGLVACVVLVLLIVVGVVLVGLLFSREEAWQSATAELPDGAGQIVLWERDVWDSDDPKEARLELRLAGEKPRTVELPEDVNTPLALYAVPGAEQPGLYVQSHGDALAIDPGTLGMSRQTRPAGQRVGTFWSSIESSEPPLQFVREPDRPALRGGLKSPGAVAVDDEGNIYVAEKANALVAKYDSNGRFLRKWHLPGLCEFLGPQEHDPAYDLAMTPEGNICATHGRGRIGLYTRDGEMLWELQCAGMASHRMASDRFPHDVTGLASDADGAILVAMSAYRDCRVVRLNPKGDVLAHWNLGGSPGGVAVDRHGEVYVAKPYSRAVVVYSGGGRHLRSWATRVAGVFGASHCVEVAAGPDDVVYASVWHETELYIAKYGLSGTLRTSWPTGIEGQPSNVSAPIRLAVDADGYVYVAGQLTGEVLKYSPDGERVDDWPGAEAEAD